METLAAIIFVLMYMLIVSEKVHRTIVAMMGAIIMIIAGIMPVDTALHHIDFNTLGVLFGMMRLNFWTYLSASWLSIAPGMVCLCILGNNLDFKSPVFWAMLALNLVLLLGSLWYTRHKLVQSSSRT